MKKLLIIAIICNIVIGTSCDRLDDNTDQENISLDSPVAGTTWEWEWTDKPRTWTFMFSENEVTFNLTQGTDPIVKQYKSTYTYSSNTIYFKMEVWDGIVWDYTGTLSGNTLHLIDSIENIDITLTRLEELDVEVLNPGYENGVVTLSKAGTLRNLLGDDYLNVTSLKVVGYINGDDIYTLRRMLGDSNYDESERGDLTSLDLSQAIIKKGGEYYYMDPGRHTYNTRNNVIGEYMFYQCSNFAHVILPHTASFIQQNAFKNCCFSCVELGDNIYSIENGTFIDCLFLNSISVGKGLKKIAADAFDSSPIDIYITDLSAWFNIERESLYCRDIYLDDAKLENLVVPEDITEIKTGAFVLCSSLTSLEIGDNVTCIGDFAFAECNSLSSVTIGAGVNKIGSKAFLKCASGATFHCYAPIPPSIADDSFDKASEYTLYVPQRYLSAYRESRWANSFAHIKEEI